MELPTQAEINAATRHLASGAGGFILAFGLSSKISPDTVQAIINAAGDLVGNLVTIAGLITPVIAAYFAKKSASPVAQAQTVANLAAQQALPKAAQIAVLNAATDVPGTEKVVNKELAVEAATTPKVTVS